MKPYAIVYPFFTSGHTVAMKNANNYIEKPKVANNKNVIGTGVCKNRSNWNIHPVMMSITVRAVTLIKAVMVHESQYVI
jgi:hypothetical protein